MQEKKLIFKKLVALMVMFLLMMLECMPILTNISLAAEDYENSVEEFLPKTEIGKVKIKVLEENYKKGMIK